jgi:hypothetical protein
MRLCDQIWIPEREDEEPVHECQLREDHIGPHVCDCGVQIVFTDHTNGGE